MKTTLSLLLGFATFTSVPAMAALNCSHSYSEFKVVQLFQPGQTSRPVPKSSEVQEKVAKWNAIIERAQRMRAFEAIDQIQDQVSKYAQKLIQARENTKLEELLTSISVSPNRVELPTENISWAGDYLTETAIHANNPEAILILNRLYQSGVFGNAKPVIHKWTLELAEAVEKSEGLQQLAEQIQVRAGSKYNEQMTKSATQLNPERRQMISQLLKNPTLDNVIKTLMTLLPQNTLHGGNLEGYQVTLDLKIFRNRETNEVEYYGMEILDSTQYRQGIFSGSYKHDNDFAVLKSSFGNPVDGGQVVSATFKGNVLEIALKLSDEAKRYGNYDTYQRIRLKYDANNKLGSIRIANGNLPFQLMAHEQTFVLPHKLVVQDSSVYFHGYDRDMYHERYR